MRYTFGSLFVKYFTFHKREGSVHSSQQCSEHLAIQLTLLHIDLNTEPNPITKESLRQQKHILPCSHWFPPEGMNTLKKVKYMHISFIARLSSFGPRINWLRQHTP